MTTTKKRAFIINCAFIACLVAIAYIAFNYLIIWLLPFLIGLLIAVILQRPINWLSKKTHLKKRFISPFITFILVVGVAFLAVLGLYNGISELSELATRLPGWYQSTAPTVIDAINRTFENILANLPDEFEMQIRAFSADIVASVQQQLVNFSSTALSWIAGKASQLPSLLITLIISVVATFFISVEFDTVKTFIKAQIPNKYRTQALDAWNTFGKTLVKMLSSYLLIMLITFVELSLGFTVLNVNYSVLIAGIIALVDILPVLGTGTVLIPWGVICLIIGNTKLGIGVIALYVIITIIRNILEPKIIGNRIGLHPLVTLIFMYLGLHIMGLFGMFLFPLSLILIKHLQDSGVIHIWKDVPKPAAEVPDSKGKK